MHFPCILQHALKDRKIGNIPPFPAPGLFYLFRGHYIYTHVHIWRNIIYTSLGWLITQLRLRYMIATLWLLNRATEPWPMAQCA